MKKVIDRELLQSAKYVEFGKLAAGFFHDIVNPVTSVSLYASILSENKSENPEVSLHIENLYQSAKNLERFVIGVRKLLQGRVINERFSVLYELQGAVDVLHYKIITAPITIKIIANKDIQLTGDNIKFYQALVNIISNAIDAHIIIGNANEDNQIKIELRKHKTDLIISIHDHGAGILPTDLEKIFKPFFSTKFELGGLGMGLVLAKEIIVNTFHGTIKVESTPTQGTIFIIKMPIIN